MNLIDKCIIIHLQPEILLRFVNCKSDLPQLTVILDTAFKISGSCPVDRETHAFHDGSLQPARAYNMSPTPSAGSSPGLLSQL
jgi:hypothetical protein